MMNWQRWIRPGLVISFFIAVLAVFFRSGIVERNLADQTMDRLASDGHDWAQVEFSGRGASIVGTAPSIEAQSAAVRSVRQIAGVGAVVDASDLLSIASPYIWSLRKVGTVITLSGFVPSEGFRTALLAATRRAMPDGEIRDEMVLARGAPTVINSAITFILSRLAIFSTATLTITDSTLAVSGVAVDPAAFATAYDIFRAQVPDQLALGPIDILPARVDPFVWSADYDGSSLTLAGFVPDVDVEGSLLATARETFPDVAIVDEMRIASGAPDGFADAAAFAVGTLARFDSGGVALDGMLLDITGKAKTVDDYETVVEAFSGALPRGMRVVSSAIAPATVLSYGWRGEKADGKVTLAGFVSSPQAKDEVLATARELFAGNNLVDNVRIAVGEPRMDWIGGIKFAMSQLARLDQGSVVLGDQIFSIEGEALSPEAFIELHNDNAQTLPASLELQSADVRPPLVSPYRFVAARTPTAIRLEGHVTSQAEREAIVGAAKDTFGTLALVDNLVYASGAPNGFIGAAMVSLHAVSRLGGGKSDISDTTITISGGAYYPTAEGAVADAVLETMPDGFNVALAITVRHPAQPVAPLRCRDLLQRALSVGRIQFDGGNADVSSDSFGPLDRVAATIERCRDTTIEVGAHTDSDGSTAQNLELSRARADAIVEYLVDAGVKRERMAAVGYGESSPVADNATTPGKAANRRIEFILQVPEDG